MFKNISKFIMSHGIGQLFNLGEKTTAWKKVRELKAGMRIAVRESMQIEFDEIISIKKLPAERVWDIEVEGTHNFVGNGIVAHNTSGILLRAGASSLQLSSSATSTTADIELAAADRIDLFAGSLSLQTSSQTAGELKLMSKGSLILDTSGAAGGGAPIALQAGSGNINLSSGTTTISGNVNLNSGILTLNGISYTFPGADSANGVLLSNGSGGLSWTTLGASSITADSLDFTEFKDELTLDADTSINGDYSLIVRAGLGARQNATSGNNDLQLAAEDAMILDADDFTLITSNTGVSSLQLISKGVLRLDTSTNNNNILLLPGTGNVGIGTTGPLYTLDVSGGTRVIGDAGVILRAGRSSLNLSSGTTSTTADLQLAAADRIDLFAGSLSLQTSSTSAGDLKIISKGSLILDTSGGTGNLIMTKLNSLGYVCTTAAGVVTAGGATCDTSDLRLKENIHPLSEDMNVLESLEKLRGVSFTWDETNPVNAGQPTGRQVGMIAQEVEQVLPSLVVIGADGYRRLDYAKMTGYLVEVAKAQQEEIAELSLSVSQTESDSESLTTRVSQLEDLLSIITGTETLSTSSNPSSFFLLPSSLSLSGSYMENEVNMGSGLISPLAKTKLTLDVSTDTVQVLGNATIGGSLTVGLLTINDLDASINSMGETLKIQNQALADIEFLGGKIVMTKTGDVEIKGNLTVAGDVIAGGTVAGTKIEILEDPVSLTSPSSPTFASIGEAVIPAGETEMTIYSTAVGINSKVFVTADQPTPIGAKVTAPGQFTIELARPTPAALKVNWWVVN